MEFLSLLFEGVALTCLPIFLFGLVIYAMRWLFCFFVGNDSGRPLLLAFSVLSTPLREAGHAIMAMIFFHRIEDMRLLYLYDPDGEFGFVEHSYNPRNPLAVLGNLFYAAGPVILGLGAVLLIFVTCFHGVLSPFFGEIAMLGEVGADLGDYARAAFSLIPRMFSGDAATVVPRIIGCALMAAICLGIYVSPRELWDVFGGFLIYVALMALTCGIVLLFDDRVARMMRSGLHSLAAAVTALFLAVGLFAVAAVLLAALFGVVRTLFNIDRVPEKEEK